MVRLLFLQRAEKHIERAAILVIILPHFGKVHHVEHCLEVSFLRRRFTDEIEHQRRIQCNFSLFPKRVIAGSVARRGILNEIVNERQHILLIVNINKGVIAIRLTRINKIEYLHIIPFVFQKPARRTQQLTFWIGDEIGAVCTVNTGFAEKSSFSGTGAAHHKDVHVALSDVAVHAKSDVLRQDDVGFLMLMIHILSIQFLRIAPLGTSVLFARSAILAARVVKRNTATIEKYAPQHEFQRMRCPSHGKRVFQRSAETPHPLKKVHAILINTGGNHRQPENQRQERRPHWGGAPKVFLTHDLISRLGQSHRCLSVNRGKPTGHRLNPLPVI